jgi:hypothetical protein
MSPERSEGTEGTDRSLLNKPPDGVVACLCQRQTGIFAIQVTLCLPVFAKLRSLLRKPLLHTDRPFLLTHHNFLLKAAKFSKRKTLANPHGYRTRRVTKFAY